MTQPTRDTSPGIAADAFMGTGEDTTELTLCAVSVEVHLGTGAELGPTERVDLGAGESTPITRSAGSVEFEDWIAHPELSSCAG